MTENERLDEIFGEGKFKYCDLCETFYSTCEFCGNSSCSGGGCEKCVKQSGLEVETSPSYYLSEEENRTIRKFRSLKKIMKESLNRGDRKIDWQKEHSEGNLSKNDEDFFAEEIK